ncbi:MAG: cyclic nucleotide-binding domain-containing protein [Eubacteriales bacterium]|nr:cyclic nucleotide-binding domain-containing protein [Eubacteriales bacterium]
MNSFEYKSGQIIFKQGDFELSMYDIQRGRIGIYSAYGTPDEKQIAELSTGEILGERGLLDRVPRSATAVVLDDDTILTEIREDNLKEYFLKEPEKLLLIMRNLSARLREMNSKLADVCRTIYESENA